MARIAVVNIPTQKRVVIALRYIYGIGPAKAQEICTKIGIPAPPSALRIGPDGSVWLAFYPDQNGGGTGVWRLSPNLTVRSGINLGTRRYFRAAPFDVLVTSADTAVLGTDHGLAVLHLPAPGQPGRERAACRGL